MNRLFASAVVLALAQILHGAVPPEVEGDGIVGTVGGSALLVASVVAAAGAWRGSSWAPRLTLIAGVLVAGGFVLYHGVPVHSPMTNPYVGEPVGTPALVTVAIAVAAGIWAAVEGWSASQRA